MKYKGPYGATRKDGYCAVVEVEGKKVYLYLAGIDAAIRALREGVGVTALVKNEKDGLAYWFEMAAGESSIDFQLHVRKIAYGTPADWQE